MADPVQAESESRASAVPPVVVKKYANRRLYNTESSSYITLDNLAEMIRQGRDFVVYDAKTGDDITRGVLTQIIVEEEGKGQNLLPTKFLRQLIGFYGGSMQGLVPKYLEHALAAFAQQQDQVRATMQKTMGNLFPFGNMEEVSRQNMAMMERAFSLFTPFYRPGEAGAPNQPSSGPPAAGVPPEVSPQEIAAMRAEIERLRRELAAARQPEKASRG
ncbi:MAG TPA: polyhydroxyalkanoate synthesis repressor PhaR [Acetobacteraceae bacterium]|jgi:polyhydroxyalkanoate synthesis repressor PhaR